MLRQKEYVNSRHNKIIKDHVIRHIFFTANHRLDLFLSL